MVINNGQKTSACLGGEFQGGLSASDGWGRTKARTNHHHHQTRKTGREVVPVDDAPIDPFGCMAGTAKICGDIIGPIEDIELTGDAENLWAVTVLDTHVWLWLVLASEALGSSARGQSAEPPMWAIFASPRWRFGRLASWPRARRIVLGKPTIAWVDEAVAASTVMIVTMTRLAGSS
jgi:hypothetical protein